MFRLNTTRPGQRNMSEPESPNLPSKPPSPPDTPGTDEYLKKAYARNAALADALEALEETRYIFTILTWAALRLRNYDLRMRGVYFPAHTDQITLPPVELHQYYVFQLPLPYGDHKDRWYLFISEDKTEEPQDGTDGDDERAKDAKRLGAIDLMVGVRDWYKRRNGDIKLIYLKKTDLSPHVDCVGPRERVPDEVRRRLYEDAEEKAEGNKEEEE
ncbi:hypothetical protein MAPG_06353 [Magnaporthiopsis poae ATCC 64411]|uniref:Uncharacterized protein n=1 Tax=Magnaporthiopsis poae (strain ATCC 64411 / 73-15) TaxID=644358 RepID=A0A0C4E1T4_MAGP6|nr:hypothetical protein MAPG_06353 [Magnaporthiopsis poae ATCC 64411]